MRYRISERCFHLAIRVGDDMVLGDFQAMAPILAVHRFNQHKTGLFKATKRIQ